MNLLDLFVWSAIRNEIHAPHAPQATSERELLDSTRSAQSELTKYTLPLGFEKLLCVCQKIVEQDAGTLGNEGALTP